jgi:hypothetical protein
MLRKGYFEQQLEALRLSLARLMGVDIELPDVQRSLGKTAKDLTGFDLSTLLRMDEATILGLFSGGDRARTAASAMISAKLLLAWAKYDPTTSRSARRKAALLYAEALALVGTSAKEYVPEFDTLLRELPDEDWSVGLRRQAARGYESVGAFARAENYHFALREENATGALIDAEAFYRRLAACSDEELADGGLPRDEVESALAELVG